MTDALLTHKPGPGGLFASDALCGIRPDDSTTGVLRMHETDYDCAICREMENLT